MSLKIKPVNEHKHWVNCLVYGDPGSGKTTFAATAEDHDSMRRVLVVNVEGGMLSIAKTGVDATEQVSSVQEVEELFWALANRADGFGDYQTVVIDSGSELQTLALQEIVAASIKKKGDKNRSPDDIHLEDYGKCTAKLKRLFRQFRDLPYHVVVTALAKREMPDAGGKRGVDPLLVYPDFTQKLAFSVMGYFDFVWYLNQDGDNNRQLLTQEHGPYKAKTRGPDFAKAIGKVVHNPNLAELFDQLVKTESKK